MINSLFTELVCVHIGTDCQASAAWLETVLRQRHAAEAQRAVAFWNHADEALQYAIGGALGWSDPHDERSPVAACILHDFNVLNDVAAKLLSPE